MSSVNHPSHYQGKIEVIEFLEDHFMSRPHEWNAVKYLARAGRKNPDKEIEDLEKSIWYIQRKIELLKATKDGTSPRRPNDMNPQSTSVIGVSNLNPLDEKVDCVKNVTWQDLQLRKAIILEEIGEDSKPREFVIESVSIRKNEKPIIIIKRINRL